MEKKQVAPSHECRAIDTRGAAYDKEKRTIALSFASEKPVRRWYGWEILSCDPANVDLSVLRDGAPLLKEHYDHIGVVESATVDADKVCRANCKLSRRDDVQQVIMDIEDGILTKSSVGYETTKILRDEMNDAKERVVTWAWKPYELTLTPMPADNTVGIGRSASGEQRKNEEKKMSDENKVEVIQPDLEAVRRESAEKASKQARQEAAEINKLAREHKCPELADKANAESWSLEQFRSELLKEIGKRSQSPAQHTPEIGMSKKEVQKYSFLRAIRSMIPDLREASGFERECSDAVAKKLGREARGIFVPYDVQVSEKRDLQITGGGTGSYVVATNLLAGSFIEALRNAMVLNRLGATYLTGLMGDIAIPKQTDVATAYWVTEGNAPTESQLTLGQITGTPHSVGANTDITRKLLMQSSVDVEALVRQDLAEVLARGIDYAAFNDAGAGAPSRIQAASGVSNPSVSSPGSATYPEILGFPSAVSGGNVPLDNPSWVTTNEVFYNLCGLPRHATASAAGFIADVDNSTIIGRPAIQSESLPANSAFFGVWRHLIVAMWGNGLDLIVDPYTQSKSGIVQVTGFMDVDFLVRHGKAFAYNTAVTS